MPPPPPPPPDPNNIVRLVRESPPLDLSSPVDAHGVAGKTILITGGASGFGAGFARTWALHGAHVVIGDVADALGRKLVDEIRGEIAAQKSEGNGEGSGSGRGRGSVRYLHCDVTAWQSQVDFFRDAARDRSASGSGSGDGGGGGGGIDAVVCNAGITDMHTDFMAPVGMEREEPPRPGFRALEVNLLGVMYSCHLAMHFLPGNGWSGEGIGDRHVLLVGSVASLLPIPGLVQYGASKHGVLGLFRSLKTTSFLKGVRINLLCPYFIDTPLIPAAGRTLLAGGAMGRPEDVVAAGTRLMADSSLHGKTLVIGPRVKVDGAWQLLPLDGDGEGVAEQAVWEVLAEEFAEVDCFTRRFVTMLNAVERTRGWLGWGYDLVKTAAWPLTMWWRGH